MNLIGDQPKAYEEIKTWLSMDGGSMYLLQGVAGTGKTFLLNDIVDLIQGKVIITAPTNKAVKVLRNLLISPKHSLPHIRLWG
jgi:excinuclease UvrABC helicase subunit UvrB